MTSLRREDGSSIELGKEIARKGGEGKIYEVVNDPNLAAKIYHAPTPEHSAKLQMMLSKRPIDYIRYNGHISIAWPEPHGRLFDAQNRCVGFLMPYIHPPTYVVHTLYNPLDRQQNLSGFTWQYLLRTARNFASVLEALHQSGYVVGDVNESNILVTAGAQVTLIDCDSMQIPRGNGLFFRCKVGKGEYTPPELQGVTFSQTDRSVHHDNFSLAVLIFLLLMEGKHPFTGIWQGGGQPPTLEENIKAGNCSYTGSRLLKQPASALPFEILPYSLQKLMVRCFVEGYKEPQNRPTAYEWHQALVDAEQHLASCSVNGQHRYSQHLRGCPWCKRQEMGLPDPFPPRKLQNGLKPVRPPPASRQSYRSTTQLTQSITPQTTSSISPPQSALLHKNRNTSSGVSRRVFLASLIGGLATVSGGAYWWVRVHTLIAHIYTTYRGHTSSVQGVAWSPDSRYIASGSHDKTVQIWDASTGKHVFTYRGHSQTVYAVAWSPDGKRIASAGQDKTVQVWDAPTWKHVFTYHGHTKPIYTLAWSPDGKYIASGGADKLVQVWNASIGKHIFTYQGHTKNKYASVYAISWSPDDKRIASASQDKTVQVWDAINGKHVLTYRGHSLDVLAVAWSPDGEYIASGGADKLVQVWNASTGKSQITYKEHSSRVMTLTWSPDSKQMASGEDQDSSPIKKVATPTHTKTMKGRKQPEPTVTAEKKNSPTVTPTTVGGSTVQVWEVTEGGSRFIYRGHTQGVNAVSWSQSKGQIASAAGDKTVQVWQVESENLWP